MLHFLVLFSTLNLILVSHALVLQKCCPSDHVFYVKEFTCHLNNLPWAPDLLEDYTDVTWSILKDLGSFNLSNTCEEIDVLENVTKEAFYLESGNLVQRNQPSMQHRDFCLDQTSEGDTLALTCPCSKGNVCVNICCEDDEILEASGQMRCVHQGEKTAIDWKFNKSEQLFALKYNSVPQCARDTERRKFLNYNNTLKLKQYEFEVLANGTLFIHNEEIKKWKEPSEYCVAVTKEGMNQSIEIIKCTTLDTVDHESQTSHRATIYVTLFVIGAIFYLATLLVHALVPDLRRAVRGLSLMAHCACMLTAHIVLTIQNLDNISHISKVYCQILAYSCKFTVMGGFFWLNVMCLDISDNFKSKKSMARSLNANYSSELRKFQRYCIYAFGVPFILMLVTIGVDHSGLDHSNPFKPNIGITRCWFEKDSSAILLYFYGPLGLLLLMNIFLFIFVGYKLASAGFLSKTMPSDNEQRYRKRVILFVKMSALMGIPWVMEIVSWAVGGEDHYWYFTDIINILRSVFVFFMFCCKAKVWEMLKNQSILAPLFQRFSCCRKIDHQDIYDPMSCGPFPSVL